MANCHGFSVFGWQALYFVVSYRYHPLGGKTYEKVSRAYVFRPRPLPAFLCRVLRRPDGGAEHNLFRWRGNYNYIKHRRISGKDKILGQWGNRNQLLLEMGD